MKNHSLHIAGAAGLRVDGIDVAQLLRDLGEASAASSAVDLFGLCLNAQRVLACVHAPGSAVGAGSASSARTASPTEIALLANYDAMDDDGRDHLASFSKHLQKRFPRRQPTLTLVEGGHGRPGHGFATSGKTNMERTSDGK